jgi:hypothetical protein
MHSRAETHNPKKHDQYKYSLNFAAPKDAWSYQTEMCADDENLKKHQKKLESRGKRPRTFHVPIVQRNLWKGLALHDSCPVLQDATFRRLLDRDLNRLVRFLRWGASKNNWRDDYSW